MPQYKRRRTYVPGVGTRMVARSIRRVAGRRLRPSRMGRVRRRFSSNVMSISRPAATAAITITGGAANSAAGAISFTLADLSNYTEYTALFDQYRIRRVQVSFRMCQDPESYTQLNTTSAGNANNFYPDIYTTVDHDDTTAPAYADIMQYDKLKTGLLSPRRWFTYTCHPTPNLQVYRGVATTGYAMASSKLWLDCAQADIPHYGVKYYIDCATITGGGNNLLQNMKIEYRVKMWCQFKNQR